MLRSRILYLIISIGAALSLASCGTLSTVEGYTQSSPEVSSYSAKYFSNTATDYVYKSNISVYGHEFGGIVIIKKTGNAIHRVAFTTEFGNKLFDFEFTDTDFKVNYIIDELDRKLIVNILRDDFRLLLKRDYSVDGQFSNGEFTVYKSDSGNRSNYLFLDKQSHLKKMVHAGKRKEKVVFTYVPVTTTLAKNIVIDHKNIKLRIELNYISE